jgi:excisionase family DNA binding protein
MSARPEVDAASLADDLCVAIVGIVRHELSRLALRPIQPAVRLLSVAEAGQLLGIGRSRLYQELGAGRLKSVKVGRRRLVPESELARYVERIEPSEESE